jgi:hypothetical protein
MNGGRISWPATETAQRNRNGCDSIRAIDAAGSVLPANYGPEQHRNH